jgi:hypothetical protein
MNSASDFDGKNFDPSCWIRICSTLVRNPRINPSLPAVSCEDIKILISMRNDLFIHTAGKI